MLFVAATIAAVFTGGATLVAYFIAMGMVAGQLLIGGIQAGFRSYRQGKGWANGFSNYINGNWACSVAIASALFLISLGISKVAAMHKNAGARTAPPDTPEPRSLTDIEARDWYVKNVRDIPNRLDNSLPLEAQTRQASALRNQYKVIARDAMIDTTKAASLDLFEPLKPFGEFVNKYANQGFTGNALWERIIKAVATPNPKVNAMFGII